MRLARLASLLSCIPGAAAACEAWVFGTGVTMLDPHGGATRAEVHVPDRVISAIVGVPARFELRGLRASPESARTLALTVGCELSARWTLHLDAGLPPRVPVHGAGTVAPPGPTSELLRLDLDRPFARSLVDQRVWSPVLTLRHRFGDADASLRPFVSVGARATPGSPTRGYDRASTPRSTVTSASRSPSRGFAQGARARASTSIRSGLRWWGSDWSGAPRRAGPSVHRWVIRRSACAPICARPRPTARGSPTLVRAAIWSWWALHWC